MFRLSNNFFPHAVREQFKIINHGKQGECKAGGIGFGELAFVVVKNSIFYVLQLKGDGFHGMGKRIQVVTIAM